MQTPICQMVTEPTADPAGGDIKHTAHLYVLVPMFSVDHDTNPNDAMPCPSGGRPGELCGPALGNALIALFGAIPEAWKTKVNPAITTQCPDPNNPVPGTCTMHASSVDLSVLLQTTGNPVCRPPPFSSRRHTTRQPQRRTRRTPTPMSALVHRAWPKAFSQFVGEIHLQPVPGRRNARPRNRREGSLQRLQGTPGSASDLLVRRSPRLFHPIPYLPPRRPSFRLPPIGFVLSPRAWHSQSQPSATVRNRALPPTP